MKQYIGIKITELDSDGNCMQYYRVYDLNQKFNRINEVYVFRLNENLQVEKIGCDTDCTESDEYNYLITEIEENSCIQLYIEGGKFQIDYSARQPSLIDISDGTCQTLEIFPKVTSRTMFYQSPKNDLDLISIKFSSYSDWDKAACVKEYEKWLSELDDEILMEFVKIYASDKNKEVSLCLTDTKEKTWRRIYTVRDASPETAFEIIKNNLQSAEAKLMLLGSMPEILKLYKPF